MSQYNSRSLKALRAFALTGCAGIALLQAGPALAQTSPQSAAQTVNIDIKANSLEAALLELGRKTGVEIAFASNTVRGKRAPAVKGSLSVDQALNRLLSGSGLSFRKTERGSVLIVAAPAAQGTSQTANTQQSQGRTAAREANDRVTGSVSGQIVSASNGASLPGAKVQLQGTKYETISDDRGFYYFSALPRGEYVVQADYLGEASVTSTVLVTSGSRQQINLMLGEKDADIVVTAYRSSIQKALNQQKNADNNVTIVSSDLLGGFPAETVSEALRRVPGVTFGRDENTGEGSQILVRGFSSEAIGVQLNGIDLQGTDTSRTIDLSGFLADNISEIRIQKSLLPSHEASGSGGLVEIETKSGLDYGDFAFNFSVEGEANTKSVYGNEYQVNGTIAKQITNNFGIVGSIQYRKTNRQNYNVRIDSRIPTTFPVGFTSIGQINGEENFPFEAEFDDRMLSGVRYSRRNRDEETITGSINLAWDIADHTKLRVDLQRNMRNSIFETSQLTPQYFTFRRDVFVPELDGEVRRRPTYDRWRPDSALRYTDQRLTTNTISFRGETTLDRWKFDYKLGYSGARTKTNNAVILLQGPQTRSTGLDAIIDPSTAVINIQDNAAMTPKYVNGGFITLPNGVVIPSLTELGKDNLINPAGFVVQSASRSFSNSPTNAYIVEGTIEYEPALDLIDYVKVGGKYDLSIRKSLDDRFATVGTLKSSETYSRIIGRNTSIAELGAGLLDIGTLADIGARDLLVSFLPSSSLETIFTGMDGLLVDDPDTAFNEERFRYRDFRDVDPILESLALRPAKSEEERFAAFFEAKISFGDFDAVGGVRMEQVTRTGTTITTPTIRTDDNFSEPREIFIDVGLVDFTDLTGTQRTWTPSVLVNYRPMENLVARLGYFRSTVNPSFALLRRPTTYSLDIRSSITDRIRLRESNPDLAPTVTDNFDLDIAYYFQDTPGLIRAGFFYKKITNNFTNIVETVGENSDVRQRVLDYLAPLADTRPDLLVFDDDAIYQLERPENGVGGTIYGVELEVIRQLDFLPGFLKDFGVLANATYTTSDFPTLLNGVDENRVSKQFLLDLPLQNQSEWVYNLSLNYARGGFDGRIIYTYQAESVQNYNIHDLNTIVPSYSTLDLRLSHTFDAGGGGWTVFVEGDDLLNGTKDADIRTAIGSNPAREDAEYFFPRTLQFNGGRTFTLGIRGRF